MQQDMFEDLLSAANQEKRIDQIREILNNPIWIPTVRPFTRYTRQHDDTDGKDTGKLTVSFGDDADAWLDIDFCESLRFRTCIGGGRSLRTRMALHILAEAIRLDNEEFPQRRRSFRIEELPEDVKEAIKNSFMDPKHNHLNHLLDD